MRRIASIYFILSALVACTKTSTPPPFVVAIESQASTLDPRLSTDANSQRIVDLIFNGLVRLGPDAKITSDGATSWSYRDLTYRFQLRKNLSFSNGRPVTRDDLLFSFEEYRSEKSPFASNFKPIDAVSVTESPEGLVVELKLKTFNASLLNDLPLLKILPKGECEVAKEAFGLAPIGTGSFVLKGFKDSTYRLTARQDHPWLVPQIKDLEIKVIADDLTRFLKIKKGEVDFALNVVPANKVKELEQEKDLRVHKYVGASMSYLLINLKDPVLKNLWARQTISYAINRDEIIKFKLEGLGQIATSILAPNSSYFNSEIKPPAFDLKKAQGLLDMNKSKGVKLTLKTSNTQEIVEISKVLSQQLTQAGFEMEIQNFEWSTFFSDVKAGRFQIASLRWVGVFDPDIYRQSLHSSETPPGRNRGSYSNPLFDKMVERGPGIENEEERVRHYKKIQALVFEDLPIVPLWYNTQVLVTHSKVQNLTPSAASDFSPLFTAKK